MRTRSRIETLVWLDPSTYSYVLTSYSIHRDPGTVSGTGSTQPYVAIDEKFSEIRDNIRSGRRPKGCTHLQYRKRLWEGGNHFRAQTFWPDTNGQPGYSLGTDANYRHKEMVTRDIGCKKLVYNPITGVIPGWTINRPELTDRQDHSMIQSLFDKARKPVIDGLLNIAESPELPGAIKSVLANPLSNKGAWQRFRNSVRTTTRTQKFRQLSKDAARRYLAWSFGLAPIIADINKGRAFLQKIKQDYSKYKEKSIRRISTTLTGSTQFLKLDDGEYSFGGSVLITPHYRYVLTYRERNPYKTEFIAKLDYLLRRFGSAGPASFAFERIPFSFVLSWFVDLSGILDYLDTAASRGSNIEVVSLTRSFQWSTNSDCFRTVKRGDTGEVVFDQNIGNVVHKYYERVPLTHQPLYIAAANRFGKRQSLLTGALLRQRLKSL